MISKHIHRYQTIKSHASMAMMVIVNCFVALLTQVLCAEEIHLKDQTYQPLLLTTNAAQIDWVVYSQLNAEQRATVPAGCQGKYVDPLTTSVYMEQNQEVLPLIIEADSSTVEAGNKAILQGDVTIKQGTRSIQAQRMIYNRTLDKAVLEGDVTIRQPGMLVVGQAATASTIENQAEFKQSTFLLHDSHIRGGADSVIQSGNGQVLLTNGRMTSCEPGSNAWALEGSTLSINQESGQGYGKHVRIKVADIPIFYIPYISFPVGEKRQSGFLFPSISSSDDGGIDIAAPYYWNIAPNYDATITPRTLSGRGAMLETEFRHLSDEFSNEFNLAFLPNDKGGVDEDAQALINSGVSEDIVTPHKGQNRWLIKLDQYTVANRAWNIQTNFTKVSDIDYLRDLSTSSFAVNDTTYLNQQLQIGYRFNEWKIDAQIQNYQVLLRDVDIPYRKLPEININGNYFLTNSELLGSLSAELKHQYTYFDIDSKSIITGQRLFNDYRLKNILENNWGYLKGEIGYKSLNYHLNDIKEDSREITPNSLNFGAAQATIDMGIALENSSGRFLQTLEPRILYLYREFEDQTALYDIDGKRQSLNFDTSVRTFSYEQLYRDSRFSGYDRLDDADQMTIGLTSRWFSKSSGRELLSGSIGQITYFSNRRVGLNNVLTEQDDSSELAANINFPVGPLAHAYINTIYNESTQKLSRFSSGVNFSSRDKNTLANVLYSYIALNPEVPESERIEQIDASIYTPINNQWSLFARANFDFENNQELESFLGFEYDDCCYRLSFLARRWLDSNIANLATNDEASFDNGIFFEIQLKGLGGSGAKVKSILEDSIPGYRDR